MGGIDPYYTAGAHWCIKLNQWLFGSSSWFCGAVRSVGFDITVRCNDQADI